MRTAEPRRPLPSCSRHSLSSQRLVDPYSVFNSDDRALVDILVSVFLERDVVVPGFHLDFHGSGLLQRSTVDDHLRAFRLALDLDAGLTLTGAAAEDLAYAAANNLDVVGAARHHQGGRVACS